MIPLMCPKCRGFHHPDTACWLMQSGRGEPGLTNDELLKLAKRFPPPREWYDEEFDLF